ncbi:hypothetical protein [Microcoleus sp. FACHB-68]|uniref:hypothetical protein n=1 Tax=Microcoleus sp. FACHB-68 TaxID=2692826 RepID=UPI0016896EAD|nr:hypothetical protein [Microcoleus sp. FACHB-68]MBD1937979.1 hypothetical protein [Microcoleus sp. FACHB-68]
MSPHKQLPNSIRNIRAKIRPLLRPAVWGTAGVLVVLGLFMSEYLANPEQFTELIPKQMGAEESDARALSPEEKARIAEIERSSALLKELKAGDAAGKQPTSANSKSLLEQSLGLNPKAGKEETKSVDPQKNPNAIGPETANLLAGTPLATAPIKGNSSPARYDTGIPSAMPSAGQIYDTTLGNSLLNATGGIGNLPPASPLQSALDRYKLGQNSSSLPSANADTGTETEAAFNAGFTGVAQSFPNKPGVTPARGGLDGFDPPYRGPRPGRDPGRLSSTGTDGINSSLIPTLPGQIAPSTNYGAPDTSLTPGTGANAAPDNSYQYLTGSPSSPAAPNAVNLAPSAPTVTPSNLGQQSPLPTITAPAPLPTSNSPVQPLSRPGVPTNASQPAFPGFNAPGTQPGVSGIPNNYGQPVYPGFNAPGAQPQGLPAIPNNYGQSPLPSLNTPSTGINSASPSNYGTPGLQPALPNAQPNYAAPGSIGNGQVNTFSNPTR